MRKPLGYLEIVMYCLLIPLLEAEPYVLQMFFNLIKEALDNLNLPFVALKRNLASCSITRSPLERVSVFTLSTPRSPSSVLFTHDFCAFRLQVIGSGTDPC